MQPNGRGEIAPIPGCLTPGTATSDEQIVGREHEPSIVVQLPNAVGEKEVKLQLALLFFSLLQARETICASVPHAWQEVSEMQGNVAERLFDAHEVAPDVQLHGLLVPCDRHAELLVPNGVQVVDTSGRVMVIVLVGLHRHVRVRGRQAGAPLVRQLFRGPDANDDHTENPLNALHEVLRCGLVVPRGYHKFRGGNDLRAAELEEFLGVVSVDHPTLDVAHAG